jgi:hypothetical protein
MMRPPITPHEQDHLDREIRARALRQFEQLQAKGEAPAPAKRIVDGGVSA